jgi:hypothetical protein
MGRWAETYFTSPPDRREEAVIELLQELEKEKDRTDTHPAPPSASSTNPLRVAHFEQQGVEERRSGDKFCGACGSENPATHQFCGMCGTRLYVDSSMPQPASNDRRDRGVPHIAFAQEHAERVTSDEESYDQGSYVDASEPRHAPAFHAPAAGGDELSLFQSFRSPEEGEEWDYEPPPSTSYRFYIAAVLLIVIGALGYMAWRGAQSSQSSREVSPPPPAPVTESAQPTTPPQQASRAPQATAPAQQTAAPKSAPVAATPAPGPVNTVSPTKERAAEREVAEKTAPPVPADHAASQQVSSSGGAEELAMAETYLNGSAGQGRNSAEAATWLWKSIAKHNGQATILLAELYLRGDGIPKNCEQGRVLLDSAARRGVPGAGDRLRNLPAFGCH